MSQAGANSTSGGGGGSDILTINSIPPNGSGNFNIDAGSNITITPGTNSITIASTGGSSGVTSLTGNSGSPLLTGAIQLTTGASNANGTSVFTASGAAITQTFDDANSNLGLGNSVLDVLSGGMQNTSIGTYSSGSISSGTGNCCFGYTTGDGITSGSDNCFFGTNTATLVPLTGGANSFYGADSVGNLSGGSFNSGLGNGIANNIISGNYNIFIGANNVGHAYTGSESSNILISNTGVLGESNVIRVGTQGTGDSEQNSTFIAGITGATPTSANTPQVVLCDNTGNLAVISSSTSGYVLTSNGTATPSFQPASGGSSFTWQTQGSNFTPSNETGYFINGSGQVMVLLPATHSIGYTFIVADIVGNGWQIVQGTSNDRVIFGNRTTTLGTGGSLTSNSLGDTLQLVATSTTGTGGVWIASLAQGNITVI